MVAHFKIDTGRAEVFSITRENVEICLGRRKPWFRQGQHRDDDCHFAVCPYCDNPIQLKGIYRRQLKSPRPYGSHSGTPIDGFEFSMLDLQSCPYRRTRTSLSKAARREMGPVAEQLLELAVAEFDRIVLILRDDFGFRFSDAFAERMLDQWFDSQAYRYTGAHLRNLPWMIAYFGPAQKLFGQSVGKNLELVDSIRSKVPQAALSATGVLEKGARWYRLDLQCLRHRMKIMEDDNVLVESMELRIQDFTSTNEALKAPTIYHKQITFDADRFERLIHTPAERAWRDEGLLERARKIAAKWSRN